jgi:hypothetical protein
MRDVTAIITCPSPPLGEKVRMTGKLATGKEKVKKW